MKLTADSLFNSWSRVASKLKQLRKRGTLRHHFKFLGEKDFKWKDSILYSKKISRTKRIHLKFVSKVGKNLSDVLITNEASFYLLSPWKHRWITSDDSNGGQKQNTPTNSCLGRLALKVSLSSNFSPANMNGK